VSDGTSDTECKAFASIALVRVEGDVGPSLDSARAKMPATNAEDAPVPRASPVASTEPIPEGNLSDRMRKDCMDEHADFTLSPLANTVMSGP
jgi:hypothetical protein